MGKISPPHRSPPTIVNRLRRADGHPRGVIEMMKAFIQDHLDHCLEEMVGPLGRDRGCSIDGFKEIAKYL